MSCGVRWAFCGRCQRAPQAHIAAHLNLHRERVLRDARLGKRGLARVHYRARALRCGVRDWKIRSMTREVTKSS